MSKFLPKIIAAHDISGMGKASLGTAMPILSYMGCYVCPLPTAVLSTITGAFSGYKITDLTSQMKDTVEHWSTLGIDFDYIYSGYLGSHKQVDIILQAHKTFGCCLVVDPVFADNGKLYANMGEDMVNDMKRLVSHADIITPNVTEAMYLTDTKEEPQNYEEAKVLLKKLCDMGPKLVIITSCFWNGELYVCGYDSKNDGYIKVKCEYIKGSYDGNGDIFTSVFLGAVAGGDDVKTAIERASDFVTKGIKITLENNIPRREGIAYEKILHTL